MAIETTPSGIQIPDEDTESWHQPVNHNWRLLDEFINHVKDKPGGVDEDALKTTIIQAITEAIEGGDIEIPVGEAVDLSEIEASIALKADNTALDALEDFTRIPTGKLQELGAVSGNVSIDAADGNLATLTVAGITTISLSASAGADYRVLTLVITGGGKFAVTWPSDVKWSGGEAPTLSEGVSILTFVYPGAWYGMLNGTDFG